MSNANQQIPTSAFKFIWQTLHEWPQVWSVWLNFFFIAARTAGLLGLSYVIGSIILISETHTEFTWVLFQPPLILLAVLGVVISVCLFIDEQLWRMFEPKWQVFVQKKLFSYLQNRSYNFFVNTHSGRVAQKITDISFNGMLACDAMLYQVFPIFAVAVIGSLMLLMENIVIGAVSCVLLVIYGFISIRMGRECGTLTKELYKCRGLVGGHLVDSLTNNTIVRLFGRKRYEEQFFADNLAPYLASGNRLYNYQAHMYLKSSLLNYAYVVVMVALMLHFLIVGVSTVADLSVQFTILVVMINRMMNFCFEVRLLAGFAGAVSEGLSVICDPDFQDKSDKKSDFSIENGQISLKNCFFSYNNGQNLFKNFDMEIKPGEKIGLIGPSGAGKSSLVGLLLRFYNLESGQIVIDGQNIADVDEDSLRKNIAVIPQDTSLFHRSLMENIRYGRLEASDAEVIEAAKKAHAHEFIKDLPQGYDTLVGGVG